ncbi:MAG: response regulator [Hyphomicrobiales bacterium]
MTSTDSIPVPPPIILVVEDEVLVRLVISEYLRHCGYRVIEAASGEEAILVMEQADIDVEVVLSDVEMPGEMDGFALAHWVRKNRPGIEIILAGTPSRAAEAAGSLCESGPHLSKPYEPQAVLDRIRNLMGKRSRMAAPQDRGTIELQTSA